MMGLLLGWLACAGKGGTDSADTAAEAVDPLAWAADAPGPYAVGYHAWSVTYTPLPEVTEGGGFAPRTIVLNLWYPIAPGGSCMPVTYTSGLPDDLACLDAPAAPPVHDLPWDATEGAAYPVLAYSHGFQGWGATSAFLARRFASHGWVVIAPDHTNNTLMDYSEPLPTAHYLHRPLDLRTALDALTGAGGVDGSEAASILAGPAATERVALAGHSFGAYTTWAVAGATYDTARLLARCDAGDFPEGGCSEAERAAFSAHTAALADPRVVAAIPMAGNCSADFFGEEGCGAVTAPALYMSGTDDPIGQADQWAMLTAARPHPDLTWIDLTGACHQAFALGGCPNLDTDAGYDIVSAYAFGLAREVLLSDASQSDRRTGALAPPDGVALQYAERAE